MSTITGTSDNDTLTGTTSADTIYGGDGNDTITGAAGNDVLYGGKGSDTLSYSSAYSNYKITALYEANSPFEATWYYSIQDISGSDGTDYISSDVEYLSFSSGAETYQLGIGSSGADALTGSSSADFLTGGAGNDTLDGGAGTDTVILTGDISHFKVTKTSTGYTVVDSVGSDGTDSLRNVESLKFSDKTINLTVQAKAAASDAASVTRLVELYVAFFNRVPDADGMSYWIDQINAGSSINSIAEAFYSAGINYSSLTGFSASMSYADFINVVYKNVLGRADGADAEALTFWGNALSSGTVNNGTLVTSILDSAHTFKGDATWGWVANLLDNKISVAKTFSIDLGLNYNSSTESISQGMAIASAITATDTSSAIALIGVAESNFILS